jgi:MFS family permease
MRAGLIMACVALPLVVAGTLMPDPMMVLAIAFPGLGLLVGMANLAIVGIQVTVPNQLRGQFTAIFSLCANFLGIGLGPSIIALLTDYVYRDESRLHHSIATVAAIMIPLGILVFAIGLKHFRRSAEAARGWLES